MTFEELHHALAERQLISVSEPLVEPAAETHASPWFVQAFAGAAAWIAGILLLAFLAIEIGDALAKRPGGFLLILGILCCFGSSILYATLSERSRFADQFALAMSFAGQFGIAFDLGEHFGAKGVLWGMLAVEALLVVGIGNQLHRFLSTVGVVLAWALAMHQALFGDFTKAAGAASESGTLSVLGWLLVWTPVLVAAWWLVRHEPEWMARGWEMRVRPIVHGLIAALAIAPLAMHPVTFWNSLLGLQGTPTSAALWPLLAALLALPTIALAFALRHRALLGLAILFGLLEISSFYYLLGVSLLVKSLLMISIGAILFLAGQWQQRARS
jgi:uncharacterized membrane protein